VLVIGVCSMVMSQAMAVSWHNVHAWDTKNGVQVYFVSTPRPHMIDVAISWPAGSAYDGSHAGLAYMTNQLVTQATEKQNAQTVSEKLDRLGIDMQTSADRDRAVINFRMLSDHAVRQQGVSIAGDIISSIDFAQSDFKRIRNNMLSAIAEREQSPSSIAETTFYKTLYNDHPYGHAVLGQHQSLRGIKPGQVSAFYHQHYRAGNAKVAIVGDLTVKQAKQLTKVLTQQLPKGSSEINIEKAKPLQKAKQVKRTFPSEQMHIILGHLGVTPQNSQRFALAIANYILGGNPLTSRLFQTIRNEHGLAYNVASSFHKLQARGPFTIQMQTKASQADRAVKLTKRAYSDFVKNNLSKQTIKRSKQTLQDKWQLSLSSNSQILSHLLNAVYYQLGPDYLKQVPQKIQAVSRQDVQRAIKRWMGADHLLTVEVGP